MPVAKTCRHCRHYDPKGAERGACTYRPPETVVQMFAALQGETALRIDYAALGATPATVDPGHSCAAFEEGPPCPTA